MVDHLVENWAEKLVAKSVGTMGILRAASMVATMAALRAPSRVGMTEKRWASLRAVLRAVLRAASMEPQKAVPTAP